MGKNKREKRKQKISTWYGRHNATIIQQFRVATG